MTPGEVHIWRVKLNRWSSAGAELSPEEHARAARFRFEELRHRWVAGRAALRQIVGQYVGIPGAGLRFARGEHGKPYLPGSRVQFNMSDSGDWALYAVTLDAEIGVDIEGARKIDAIGISQRFMPESEAAVVRENPASFFRMWTRREAFLKCIGVGLHRVGAPIPPGYFIAHLDPAPGYAAAAVWEGGERRLVMRDFAENQTIL